MDHVCRVGGSRFAIIMSRVDSGIQEQVARKIDHVNEVLRSPGGDLPAASLVVGVAFADRVNPGDRILEDAEAVLAGLKARGGIGCAFH